MKRPLEWVARRLGLSLDSREQVTGWSIDSRRLQAGDLFFALRGPNHDGHQYVAVLSGVGGWSGAIVAGGLDARDSSAALGFVNAMRDLPSKTKKGGMLFVFGARHPRTIDEHVPLDRTRMLLALFALIMFILCFTPAPIEPMELLKR